MPRLVRWELVDEVEGVGLGRREHISQCLGPGRGHELVDVDLVLPLGPRDGREVHRTLFRPERGGRFPGSGLACTVFLGVVADDDAPRMAGEIEEMRRILFAKARGHRGDAGHAGLASADAVGDPLCDEQFLRPASRVLVVEGVVADGGRDVQVPVRTREELFVLGLLPRLVPGKLGGPGDEVDHLAALPVGKHQAVPEEVLDAPARDHDEEPGLERLGPAHPQGLGEVTEQCTVRPPEAQLVNGLVGKAVVLLEVLCADLGRQHPVVVGRRRGE